MACRIGGLGAEGEPDPRAVDLLQGAGRRRWRVIALVGVLVIVGVAVVAARRTASAEVIVRVDGAGCSRRPSVVLNGGGDELEVFERVEVELPWQVRYQLHPGDDVMLTASGDSGCTLTCRIAIDGAEKVRHQDVGDVDCQARVE